MEILNLKTFKIHKDFHPIIQHKTLKKYFLIHFSMYIFLLYSDENAHFFVYLKAQS